MSAYLCGYSFTCAQGDEHTICLAAPRPPDWQPSHILGEHTALPYHKAFAPTLLTLDELLPLLEQHLRRAAKAARWPESRLAHIPILLGSSSYVAADREARIAHGVFTPRYTLTEIAHLLGARLRNPHIFSLATSCTSAAHAIAQASHLLANGFATHAMVLGFETFNRMTFEHFHALGLLAGTPEERGIILGEAIACLALSRDAADSRARLYGITTLNDHANLTDSSAPALEQLLDTIQAHHRHHTLAGIKIHATGGNTDHMEQHVLRERFPHLAQQAWKKYTGHTLGATAALETALTLHHPPAPGTYLHYYLGFGGSNIGWLMEC